MRLDRAPATSTSSTRRPDGRSTDPSGTGGAADRPPRPTRAGALTMNAATRAASSAPSPRWCWRLSGCSGHRARRRHHVRDHARHEHGAGLPTGDLAVLRPADDYEVGDVVAYRSDGLDTTVMHRIVERDGTGSSPRATTTPGSTRSPPAGPGPGLALLPRSAGRQGPRGPRHRRPSSSSSRSPSACVMWVLRRPGRRGRGRGAGRAAARFPPPRFLRPARARPVARPSARRRRRRGRRLQRPPGAPGGADRARGRSP